MRNFDDEFRKIADGIDAQEWPTETVDPTPYGTHPHPVKPGLTRRGKAAIAISAAIIGAGALIGYQAYSSSASEDNAKAQEIALQQQRIELDKLKEINRAHGTQAGDNKNRQASIDKCVKNNKDMIGKGYNSSYRDIVDACQAQYTPTTGTDGMQNTSATGNADTNHDGGNIDGLLIGGGALGLILIVAFKKNTRSHQS